MPNWGELAGMAGKALSGEKKQEKKKDENAPDWSSVGQSAKKAGADGNISAKEAGDLAKKTYEQYSKDKKDGTAPKVEEIGKNIIKGFFKK